MRPIQNTKRPSFFSIAIRSLPQWPLVLLILLTLASPVGDSKWFFLHVPGYRYHPGCNPTTITTKDIRNFHKVDDDLYRGAPPTCRGYARLSALRVRTIIFLEGGGADALKRCARRERLRLGYVPFDIPLFDTVIGGISDQNLARLFVTMQHAPKPIFITCKFGEDRTGLVVALYRMKRGEMSFQEAEQEAYYYGMSRHGLPGITMTLDRFKHPEQLRRLPAPTLSARRPKGVCKLRTTERARRSLHLEPRA